MENVVFECVFQDSEEFLHEAYKTVYFKSAYRSGWCLLVCGILVTLSNFLIYHPLFICWAVGMLAVGIYGIFYSRIYVKRMIKNTLRINNGQIPNETLTVTDRITYQYKLKTVGMLFFDVTRVYLLKRSIVIYSKEGSFIIDRNGFTKGTPEELEQFLREKCPNARFFNK